MNNKIYRLQNRLKNKKIEVAKLTEKIVDNELKLRESFRCSLFTVLITLVSVVPAFLIVKFVPSLYILGVPFLITGSYIMSYSVMEIYEAIKLLVKVKRENKELRNKAIQTRALIEKINVSLIEEMEMEESLSRVNEEKLEVAKENRECLEEVDTLENRNVLKLWKR
ncbi:MAG TPA: hypothetical protein DD613_02205 [Firmicutes bacterium]|nr:hypothetical protein [Bacillota bacterium]